MRFLRRKPYRHVVLYGKPGCHLCEEARALLERQERHYQLRIDEVDIRQDPELLRRYDLRIPVIVVEGREEIDTPINQDDLRKALR